MLLVVNFTLDYIPVEDGKVRSCGWNKHFQTGIAIQNDEIKALIEVPYPTPVAKVSCGWNHSITIDSMLVILYNLYHNNCIYV